MLEGGFSYLELSIPSVIWIRCALRISCRIITWWIHPLQSHFMPVWTKNVGCQQLCQDLVRGVGSLVLGIAKRKVRSQRCARSSGLLAQSERQPACKDYLNGPLS